MPETTIHDILAEFRKTYGDDVSKEDIFYNVHGILHSPEYRERFAADLKKMLPRIPLTKERADYQAFTQAGRDLAHWHLNYETIDPHPDVHEETEHLGLDPWELYKVQKMTFVRPTAAQKAEGLKHDDPRYIIDLLKRVARVSLETNRIVASLPALNERT